MTVEMLAGYRATMFDGEADLDWLRQAWRALRLYGRKARAAIGAGEMAQKAAMLQRADRLLILLTGILESGHCAPLGQRLAAIYAALQAHLLRANINNDLRELEEFEKAIDALVQGMLQCADRDAYQNSPIVTAA